MTETPADRLEAAVAALLPDQGLFEVLDELERSLGAGMLDSDATLPVRIEVIADRSSPVAEIAQIHIDESHRDASRAVIRAAVPGLVGTMGRAGDRIRDECGAAEDPALPLLDMFHHRMLTLLHREWRYAGSTATAAHHPLNIWCRHRFRRPDGGDLLAAATEWGGSAEGLRGAVAQVLGSMPVRVREGVVRTAGLDDGPAGLGDRSVRLGHRFVLGSQVSEAVSTVEIVIGPAAADELDRLLDPSPRRDHLRHWVSELLPDGMIAVITVRYPRPDGDPVLRRSAGSGNRLGRDVWLPRGRGREAKVSGGRVESRSWPSDRAATATEALP